MKTLICSLLLSFISFNSFSQSTIVDKRTGISIIFSADGEIFPNSWTNAKINGKGESLTKNEYSRSERVVLRALSKYPLSVIKNNLKTIYVLNRIEFYGQSYGGTNSTDIVYLSNKGISKGYTDFYLEQLFHAEFSSVLFRNYKQYFDENEWRKNNLTGFKYGKSGVDALKKGLASEAFDDKINESGLLNQYSMSSLENDFNAFAKNLFLPKKGFTELLEQYDRIANKREQLIEFYNKINHSFTEDIFNKLLKK